jgi:hypothetical protein
MAETEERDFVPADGPAQRADIHRLRNEVQVQLGSLSNRLSMLERDVAVLTHRWPQQVNPIELGAKLEKIEDLTDDVKDLKVQATMNNRRILVATGAVSAIVVLANWLVPILVRG